MMNLMARTRTVRANQRGAGKGGAAVLWRAGRGTADTLSYR
jgi:hypothetical protein